MKEDKDLAQDVQDTPQNATTNPAIGPLQGEQQAPGIAEIMELPEVQEAINKAVQEGIREALKGKTPQRSTADPLASERAEFKRMSYKERLQLFNTDPNRYHKLVGGK